MSKQTSYGLSDDAQITPSPEPLRITGGVHGFAGLFALVSHRFAGFRGRFAGFRGVSRMVSHFHGFADVSRGFAGVSRGFRGTFAAVKV